MNENFRDLLIAITDLETTGVDHHQHEIIELGLVVIRQGDLAIVNEYQTKIKPLHPETADPEAIIINGYTESEWHEAIPLHQAMMTFSKKTVGSILLAHNITFDWSFLDQAFRECGLPSHIGKHRLDLPSIAWAKLWRTGLSKLNLRHLAMFLNVPEEPKPHRAINGARTAYEVYKKLMNY